METAGTWTGTSNHPLDSEWRGMPPDPRTTPVTVWSHLCLFCDCDTTVADVGGHVWQWDEHT